MLNQGIEVTAIRPYEGSQTLMAYVDVKIGDVLIHGVKIMQNDKNELWTAMPSVEKNGKFFDVVEIDSRSRERQIKVEIVKQYKQKTGLTDNTFGYEAPEQPFGFSEEDPCS